MNIETIKSFFLILLVSLSLLLTWGLWTYYPTNEFLPNSEVVQDETIGKKKDIQLLILPEQVLYHKDNNHYISSNLNDINVAYKEIQGGSIEEIEDITDQVDKDSFTSFIHGNEMLEILFPSKIPKLQLDLLLRINDRSISETLEFDRIVIDFKQSSNNNIKIYFVNYYEGKIYEGYLSEVNRQKFYQQCNNYYVKMPKAVAYPVTKTNTLFLQDKGTELYDETYLISQLNPDSFKNALFTDPSYVKEESTLNSDSYIDGTRLLKVFYDNQYLQYVNQAIASNQHSTSGPLIQKSIDFINNHQGWTDAYRLYDWTDSRGETVFRMYQNNLPIFNQSKMASILLQWGEEDVISYRRSLFKINSNIQTKKTEVQLPSGSEVIQFIKESKELNSEEIKEIFIGYEMNLINPTNKYITLTPTWIIKSNSKFKKIVIPEGEEGVRIVGLESY